MSAKDLIQQPTKLRLKLKRRDPVSKATLSQNIVCIPNASRFEIAAATEPMDGHVSQTKVDSNPSNVVSLNVSMTSGILKRKRSGHSRKLKLILKPQESIARSDPKTTKLTLFMTWALSKESELCRHFTVIDLLGWGGCGLVMKARRHSDSKMVAVKVIYKTVNMPLNESGLPHELEIMKSVSHKHLIRYLDHFKDERAFYLVSEIGGTQWRHESFKKSSGNGMLTPQSIGMQTPQSIKMMDSPQWTNGSTSSLFDFIDEFGKVPEYLIALFFKQIASALGYLHVHGIVHGDVKEENVLVGFSSRTGRYKLLLCDLGHARKMKQGDVFSFYGTREVSAPELLVKSSNSRLNGFAQDVWALGLVLYTMIHGQLPSCNARLINGTLDLKGQVVLPAEYIPMHSACLSLLQSMLSIDSTRRPTLPVILSSDWLE